MNPAAPLSKSPAKPPTDPPRAEKSAERSPEPATSFAKTLARTPACNAEGEPDDLPATPPPEVPEAPPAPLDAGSVAPLPTPPAAMALPLSAASPGAALPPSGGEQGTRRSKPDPLDPAARHTLQMAPLDLAPSMSPGSGAPGGATAPDVQARASLESLVPELVRKIAWSGDGKRGSMRLELGKGALAGGVILVHADDGRVRVEVDAPSGTDTAKWKANLEERLAQRGVAVDDVVVK